MPRKEASHSTNMRHRSEKSRRAFIKSKTTPNRFDIMIHEIEKEFSHIVNSVWPFKKKSKGERLGWSVQGNRATYKTYIDISKLKGIKVDPDPNTKKTIK